MSYGGGDAAMYATAQRLREKYMSKPPPSKPKRQHVFYTADDFTPAEIARRNMLAVLVIDAGHAVCKFCSSSNIDDEVLTDFCDN